MGKFIENKVTVIGDSLAAIQAVCHMSRWSTYEIDWIHDSSVNTISLGETLSPQYAQTLRDLGFRWDHLLASEATPFIGYWKEGWGTEHDTPTLGQLPFGHNGIHASSSILSKIALKDLDYKNKVRVYDKKIPSYDELDTEFIIETRYTKPEDYTNLEQVTNSVYNMQCPWDLPRYMYTKQIARPYGFINIIPLQNRASVSYYYNKDITNLETIKEDLDKVLIQEHLTSSDITIGFDYTSYKRELSYNKKVAYLGRASYSLEPLAYNCLEEPPRTTWDYFHGTKAKLQCNLTCNAHVDDSQDLIMLQYLSGSKYDTEFWNMAQEKAKDRILNHTSNKDRFLAFLAASRSTNPYGFFDFDEVTWYGDWDSNMMRHNLLGLGLNDVLRNLKI